MYPLLEPPIPDAGEPTHGVTGQYCTCLGTARACTHARTRGKMQERYTALPLATAQTGQGACRPRTGSPADAPSPSWHCAPCARCRWLNRTGCHGSGWWGLLAHSDWPWLSSLALSKAMASCQSSGPPAARTFSLRGQPWHPEPTTLLCPGNREAAPALALGVPGPGHVPPLLIPHTLIEMSGTGLLSVGPRGEPLRVVVVPRT